MQKHCNSTCHHPPWLTVQQESKCIQATCTGCTIHLSTSKSFAELPRAKFSNACRYLTAGVCHEVLHWSEAFKMFRIMLLRLISASLFSSCNWNMLFTAPSATPVVFYPLPKFHVHFARFRILDNAAFNCTRPTTMEGSHQWEMQDKCFIISFFTLPCSDGHTVRSPKPLLAMPLRKALCSLIYSKLFGGAEWCGAIGSSLTSTLAKDLIWSVKNKQWEVLSRKSTLSRAV